MNVGSISPGQGITCVPSRICPKLVDERRKMHHSPKDLESIRRDIAERLRPTCMNMSDVDFEKMVARMALIEWKHLNDSTPTSQMQSH
jgi:hypothetical protein